MSPTLDDVASAARLAGEVAGRAEGRKLGRIAGLREAADLLVQWGATARESGDEFEGKVQEESAESLRPIADRLEEEAMERPKAEKEAEGG